MKHRFGLLALLMALGLSAPIHAQEADTAGAPAAETAAPAEAPAEEATPAEAAPTEETAPADTSAEMAPAEATPTESTEAPAEAAPMDSTEAPAEAAPMESTEAPAEVAPMESAEAAAEPAGEEFAGGDEFAGGEEEAAPTGPVVAKGRWYVAPMFSYLLADDDRGTDDGFGGSLSIGRRMTDGLNLELIAHYSQMDAESGGGSAKIKGVGLGAQISWLSRWPRLYMPVNLMYGTAEDHPGPIPDYKTTLFDVGLGYFWPISEKVILRTEALYRVDAHGRNLAGTTPGENKHFYDGVFSVGLMIPLGHTAKPVEEAPAVVEAACPPAPEGAAVDERGCMLDADGDGVADNLDQCPDTPTGTPVNAQGCPTDSDGDGVPDEIDECPNSPAGAKVLANGCALQGDCRKPRPGEQVDENGCAAEQKFILKGVKFEFDSDRLTEEAKTILVDVGGTMNAYPDVKVELQGHTDNIGTDAYNLGLSERRANSVKTFLTGQNVDADRMRPQGYGESQPIDTNDTEEGRENNRRVELKVVE